MEIEQIVAMRNASLKEWVAMRGIVLSEMQSLQQQNREQAEALKQMGEVVNTILAIGGSDLGGDFSGAPLECYCGSVMNDDGELDENETCLVCKANTVLALPLVREAMTQHEKTATDSENPSGSRNAAKSEPGAGGK